MVFNGEVLKTLRTSYTTGFTTLHGSHHGVFFLMFFSKIHTTFHTKFTPLLFEIAIGNFSHSHWNDVGSVDIGLCCDSITMCESL